jgi:hypothetical protein
MTDKQRKMEGIQVTRDQAALGVGFLCVDDFELWRAGGPGPSIETQLKAVSLKRLGDGEILDDGMVISFRRDKKEAVLRCHCGHEQPIKHGEFDGILKEEAIALGWYREPNLYTTWECPNCVAKSGDHKLC